MGESSDRTVACAGQPLIQPSNIDRRPRPANFPAARRRVSAHPERRSDERLLDELETARIGILDGKIVQLRILDVHRVRGALETLTLDPHQVLFDFRGRERASGLRDEPRQCPREFRMFLRRLGEVQQSLAHHIGEGAKADSTPNSTRMASAASHWPFHISFQRTSRP